MNPFETLICESAAWDKVAGVSAPHLSHKATESVGELKALEPHEDSSPL